MMFKELVLHNSAFLLPIFARVVYLKDKQALADKARLVNLAKRLYKEQHLSVFEHQWFYLSIQDKNEFKNRFIKFSLNYKLPISLRSQVFVDNDYIAFTGRTLIAITKFSEQCDFLADINRFIKNRLIKTDPFGYWLYYDNETDVSNYVDLDNLHIQEKPLAEFKHDKLGFTVELISATQLGTRVDAFTFRLANVPIYIDRQIKRHRFGVFTEQSLRVVKVSDQKFRPAFVTEAGKLWPEILKTYEDQLEKGFRKEDAREILPLAFPTTSYWTLPRESLENYLQLMLEKHAQWQHRELAKGIKQLWDFLLQKQV